MTPSQVDVAVVVVSYNSAHVIGELMESLAEGLGGLAADVVVVDNGSSDRSVDLLSARADCRVVRSTNLGYSAGINRGVAAAQQAEAILVLNPDAVLFPDSVPKMLRALNSSGAGIVVPQLRDHRGDLLPSLRREPSLPRACGLTRTGLPALSEHIGDPRIYRRQTVVDWATGAAMLMARGCYEALSGWDESYFLYSEETDFCLRARDAGFATLYEPTALVRHRGGESGRSPLTHSMQVLNRVRLYGRRHGRIASFCYYGLILANEMTRIVRGGGRSSRRAVRDLLLPRCRPMELHASKKLLPP